MANKCICCFEMYTKNEYDFYSLCDDCFYHFDSQKMRGRIMIYVYNETPKEYTESAKEFVNWKKCTHETTI
jgi:hypothetical protein